MKQDKNTAFFVLLENDENKPLNFIITDKI